MKMKVTIISKCPACNSILNRIKDQLFCDNETCGAQQVKKLVNFAKVMKIKGLGEKTIERLELETIEDIYIISKEYLINIIGEKLGEKLFVAIQHSTNTSLEKVLPAFSISLVGTTAAKKLNKVVSTLDEITFDICKEAGLGNKVSLNLCDWLEYNKQVYENLPFTFKELASSQRIESKNIKVCITGKLNDYQSRELASSFLESKGITVVSGVSKTLDYLINEDNKPSSKLSKATEYGIPIFTIKQLIQEIKK
jgi:NAD-dependent DNA ligase